MNLNLLLLNIDNKLNIQTACISSETRRDACSFVMFNSLISVARFTDVNVLFNSTCWICEFYRIQLI